MSGNVLMDSGYRPYFELFVYGKKDPLRIIFFKSNDGSVSACTNYRYAPVVYSDLHSAVIGMLDHIFAQPEDCYMPYLGILKNALDYAKLIESQPMLF
jgi:hypothetical protein